MANPQDDWKIWLIINPTTWLVPIWIVVLATAVVIHVAVIGGGKYNFLAAPAKVAVK
jgi:hypothetical protein